MAGQLIFNEENFINDNIFKFEDRLKSHLNKYVEKGFIFTTYFSQAENATTVDRGIRDIEQLFGSKSPLRFNRINNFPIAPITDSLNPDNTDEQQFEDINVEGEYIVYPSTIVPKPMDFFIINHLKMKAIFEVTDVSYDSMKVEGYYKIKVRLHSTSEETLANLNNQVEDIFFTDLNSIGTNTNPIIKEEDFIYKQKVEKMICKMIESYKSLFYNQRHNCFLFFDQESGRYYFDLCGNEFIAKHGLMNVPNSMNVIVLHEKIRDIQMEYYYNNSIFNWIEIGAPLKHLQQFYCLKSFADAYPTSSFALWGEGDVIILIPLAVHQNGINAREFSYFDTEQINSFMSNVESDANEYEKLIWKYIHNGTSLKLQDISLELADALLSSIKHIDLYLYIPIIIYIIRQILQMN